MPVDYVATLFTVILDRVKEFVLVYVPCLEFFIVVFLAVLVLDYLVYGEMEEVGGLGEEFAVGGFSRAGGAGDDDVGADQKSA